MMLSFICIYKQGAILECISIPRLNFADLQIIMKISVRKIPFGDPEIGKAFEIRKKVFVDEQNCPADLEYQNDDVSIHFLAICDGTACGAARWRQTDKGIKLERFAVLPEYRGRHVGAALVHAVLNDIKERNLTIYLNAQLSALGFYLPFGFEPVGDIFEEAGIRHRQMVLSSRG
jgi:predicted GNAT family N-acyltransferase